VQGACGSKIVRVCAYVRVPSNWRHNNDIFFFRNKECFTKIRNQNKVGRDGIIFVSFVLFDLLRFGSTSLMSK